MKASIKFKEITAKLIEKIKKEKTKQWFVPWNNSLPNNFITGRNYTGINILILWDAAENRGYSTNQWLTFNQIKSINAAVKKGEKATKIFFFKPIKIEEKEKGVSITKTIPLLKTYNVFNVEQTTIKIAKKRNKKIPDIEKFIANTGAVIKLDHDAYYHPRYDYIGIPNINKFLSKEHYYSTLLHELAHWTGHPSRLDRDQSGGFGSKKYAFEELVAETASCFLNAQFQIDWQQMQHAEYLQSWLKAIEDDPKMLLKAASHAQKIVDFLNSLQNRL